MSAALPRFRKGDTITAEQMRALAGRIRVLMQRQTDGCITATQGMRRIIPGRAFAFQLGEMNGVLWYRCGWLELAGQLTRVGDAEWNPLCGIHPCTVWLEMPLSDGGGFDEPRVVFTDLDMETPETATRRRLGYVRTEDDGNGGTLWHLIQVCGGMMSPTAPRRQMGTAYPEDPSRFRKSDTGWMYLHAGHEPQTNGRVTFGYACQLGEVPMPTERGGRRFAQVMAFNTSI